MKRTPIVAGNWKMYTTRSQAAALAAAIALEGTRLKPGTLFNSLQVVLCPPFTALATVSDVLRGSAIALGAQDCHGEPEGAFTGEVSAPMLLDCGVAFVIVGHSERRRHMGESDGVIHRKLQGCLAQGLKVILCVGETQEERQRGQTWEVIERQLEAALASVEPLTASSQLVLAYEPVWAIGTGINATAEEAQEVHRAIRDWLTKRLSLSVAQAMRILYGGSVKPGNTEALMRQPDVDGLLVGGASLKADDFLSILQSAVKAKRSECSTPLS